MSEISKQALKVDNNTSFPDNNTGYISPSILRAFNVNVIDSTVNQTTYLADSASWNSDIAALEAFTASQQPSFNSLNAFTASQTITNNALNQFTQSAGQELDSLSAWTGSWEAWTSSINEIRDDGVLQGYSTRFFFNGLVSASIVTNVDGPIANVTIEQDGTKLNTASFNAYTASEAAAFTAYSQSVSSSIKVLNDFTASANVSIAALNAYTASDDVSIDLLNAFTASQNSLNATFATTGSNTFRGNQTITGSVTISSSAAVDLAVTGTIKVTSNDGLQTNTIAPNTFNIETTRVASVAAENFIFASTASAAAVYVGVYDSPNFNTDIELKLSADSNGLSFNDWDNGSTFSYVPFITVEPNLGNNPAPVFTRGLVVTGSAAAQNLNVSGSVVISGSTNLRGNLTQNTGSITAFGNVRTTNGLFSSSINGGLEIAGLGYVGSGSAGAYFIGTTTQDLKIQNWYSSSVDGKNIVIENYSPTGSNPIFGKVALRARGEGGAVTVENTSQFRVECNTQITGSVSQNVSASVISLATASIDLNVANYFTLNLSGSTRINVTNPKPGVTATLVINTDTGASASFSSNVKQPSGSFYAASPSGNIDIITFTAVDTNTVYAFPAQSFV